MKRLLLITLLVLSHGTVYAAWVLVAKDIAEDGATTYADPDTIRRKGELVKMWALFDFETVQIGGGTSYLSMRVQRQFDCADERTRLLTGTWFLGNMGTGDISLDFDEERKWQSVPPGSVSQALWTIACRKQ